LVIQIYGDRGWLQANFTEGTCVIHYPNQVEERLPAPEHADQIYPAHAPAANLVEIILGKAANGSPPEIGWRTVELLDAAHRSAANGGQAVPVDSLYGA
jgi:predicted dehydrogenase